MKPSDVNTRTNTGRRKSLTMLAGYFILVFLLTLALIPLLKKLGSFHGYVVPSSSMEPSIYAGDRIFVNENYYQNHALADGDLVVFRHNDLIIVKRLPALSGETIEGRNAKLIRNGIPLEEPYIIFSTDNPLRDMETFEPRQIPDGQIFVTGDSRDGSLDSRSVDFGTVHSADVLGRVSLIYYSSHSGQLGRRF